MQRGCAVNYNASLINMKFYFVYYLIYLTIKYTLLIV